MRKLWFVAVLAALAALAGTPAIAETGPTVEVIATGLQNPRGLDFGSDQVLYVAEAGVGGAGPCQTGPEGDACFGSSGGVSAIRFGQTRRVVDGLPSTAAPDGTAATGPHDVSGEARRLLISIGLGGDLEYRAGFGPDASLLGHLVRGRAQSNQVRSIADLAAFEAANNPDGGEVDSNPYGLAMLQGRTLVTDAGGNDLLSVRNNGQIEVIAVFPDRLVDVPFPDFPMQAVPTTVAVGPDGAYYVGQLTGFPFPVGGANVYRVVPGEEPTVYASGFTNIIDIAFAADGSLYVLEIATNSLLGEGPGGLWTVPPGGGAGTQILTDPLFFPGGIEVGADGSLYITNLSILPDGQVLKVSW